MKEQEASKLEWRMYGLVPCNISPIQQGIQFGHAVVEYSLAHGSSPDYNKWSMFDKTFIILNGGTTNLKVNQSTGLPFGTLNQYDIKLAEEVPEIPRAQFYEPDLGDQLTAICFLVDERVWDREKYPDFVFDKELAAEDEIFGGKCWEEQYYDWKMKFSSSETKADHIIWLRDFLAGFKLA